ncbi:hypothetical protein Fmac_005197 [Flemingia macrophylla]|uniref:Anthocyanidin reductase n=1 Tax=Flemingia macrophylla TaxID=520843 RepID=A0ABD1N739_9FABA
MANVKHIGKKACVIGGSGFMASLLIKQLLQKGYAVNTTVRDPVIPKKCQLLLLQRLGKLKIFGADLTVEEDFNAPLSGSQLVFLFATPNFSSEDPEGYPASKALAKKAAWKFAEENGIDLITVIPTLTIGPSITLDIPTSVGLATSLITGSISITHVEDICRAHIFVAEKESASGRYIVCAHNTSVPELAGFLSQRYPQYKIQSEFDDIAYKTKLAISSEKLIKEGFSFKYGIEEIFYQTVEYLRSKGALKN